MIAACKFGAVAIAITTSLWATTTAGGAPSACECHCNAQLPEPPRVISNVDVFSDSFFQCKSQKTTEQKKQCADDTVKQAAWLAGRDPESVPALEVPVLRMLLDRGPARRAYFGGLFKDDTPKKTIITQQ
jgi:hypothetical protein